MNWDVISVIALVTVLFLAILLDQFFLRKRPRDTQNRHERMASGSSEKALLKAIEDAKKAEREKLEKLLDLGQAMLEMNDFKDPKLRKQIERGMREGKASLRFSKEMEEDS